MTRVDIVTNTIHSDIDQEERERTMLSFRKGELKILIATDVSARGIDIPNVDFVVNYDLPETAENYVHRVGRTGRGTQKGQAFSFCSSEEKGQLTEIENKLGKPIQRLTITKKEYKETLDFTDNQSTDWRALMEEEETHLRQGSGGRGKKKPKKKKSKKK